MAIATDAVIGAQFLDIGGAVFNVKHPDFGATGDGVTDDTAAIQLAIDAVVAAGGGIVYLPVGVYLVSSSLTIGASGSTTTGVRLVGAGAYNTTILPTSAFASSPIILFTNGRSSGVEDMSIRGNATAPESCIESHCDTPGAGSLAPTNMRFANLWLGEAVQGGATNTIQYGIRFTATTDQNNDLATIENVNVLYFTQAGLSIEHINSLQHVIIGGRFSRGPIAVKVAGGSFAMFGTTLGEITEAEFSLGTSTYKHPIQIHGVKSEINTGVAGAILVTTASKVDVKMTAYERVGAKASTTQINFLSVGGRLDIVDSFINLGQTNVSFVQNDTTSHVSLISSRLGFTDYTINGTATMIANRHEPGTVTITKGASGKLYALGEKGGSLPSVDFVPDVETLADDATPSVASFSICKTGGTTTITDFDDGIVGQTIKILSAHAITITDNAAIILNGSGNFVMADTDTLTLTMFNDQVWNEVARSDNS